MMVYGTVKRHVKTALEMVLNVYQTDVEVPVSQNDAGGSYGQQMDVTQL